MNNIEKSENINQLWANLIVEELSRAGINYYCISPGSRSTPLTIAAGRHTKAKTRIIYDERGSAFHALGYARACNKPAVLICTSGTAAANYYPAVIEASLENIPMLILSADRPPELRETGANQTIDQIHLFGSYTRWFFDMPCPDEAIQPQFVLSNINYGLQKSCGLNPGPVHINCMFREPLAPKEEKISEAYLKGSLHLFSYQKVVTKSSKVIVSPTQETIKQISDIITTSSQGIILAGRQQEENDKQYILSLAGKLNWPLFSDITSGLRAEKLNNNIHHFDSLLLIDSISQKFSHYPVIHFGGQFVSKRLLQFLANHQGPYIHVSPFEKRIDPVFHVSCRIQSSARTFIESLLNDPDIAETKNTDTEHIIRLNSEISGTISEFCKSDDAVSEISVAKIVSDEILDDSCLFLASSMPVRDFDTFASFNTPNLYISANRGASGIDGTIASALGYAEGLKKPLTLVIGDIAFIHDINALTMLRDCETPVTIILINNHGGGIFSFLPVADFKDVFEKFFGTPHDFTFSKMAELFNLVYQAPSKNSDFIDVYREALRNNRHTLIEIQTNRSENQKQHLKIHNEIRRCLP